MRKLEKHFRAVFQGPAALWGSPEFEKYIKEKHLEDFMDNAVHVVWATGGSLVPEKVRAEYVAEATVYQQVPGTQY